MFTTCDATIPGHGFDHESLEAARSCGLVDLANTLVEHRAFGGQLVAEHTADLPCPLCPPVQGPAPDELEADAECVAASCDRTCDREPYGFVTEAHWNGMDAQVYCQCEHHDPSSGFAAAAVRWLREGR